MNDKLYHAACASAERIADLCVQAFQEKPERLLIEISQSSTALELADQEALTAAFRRGVARFGAGTEITLQTSGFFCRPQYPAAVKLSLNKGKKNYYFFAAITGEGACVVYEFDRCPLDLEGNDYDFLVFIETWASQKKDALSRELLPQLQEPKRVLYSGNGTCELLLYRCGGPVAQPLIDELNGRDYVQLALEITPFRPQE